MYVSGTVDRVFLLAGRGLCKRGLVYCGVVVIPRYTGAISLPNAHWSHLISVRRNERSRKGASVELPTINQIGMIGSYLGITLS
jgi:hypothetical protein